MIYRFGHFQLDDSARELHAGDDLVDAEPKAFDLLVYLIENRDRAVAKDELLNAIWPRQIVTETALTRAIMKARRAVGDDATRQTVIRTVHGHGYRFIADLQSEGPVAPVLFEADEPAARPPPHRPRWQIALAGLAALAVISATVFFTLRDDGEPFGDGAVAVLPVHDATDDSELAWVRLGLMSLLQRMLEEGGTNVLADRAVLAAVDGLNLDVPPGVDVAANIRRKTGADSILHTTLGTQGGLHRLSAVLLHPDGRRTRRVIVGSSPAAIAADMANVFSQLFTGDDNRGDERFAKTSTDPFVNEMYARALDLELQGRLEEARQLFRLAADQEPELFWLRYEIALCTRDLREWDEAEAMFNALYAEARQGSEPRALLVTLNSHGIMQLKRNRYDEAGDLFLESLAVAEREGMDYERATVLTNLALIATRRGDFEAADLYYQGALTAFEATDDEAPPHFLNNYAGLLLRLGDLARARAFSERAVEGFRVKGHRRFEAPSVNRLARILRRQGDLDGALARHQEAVTIYREIGNEIGELSAMGAMTTVYRNRGDLTRAEVNAEEVLGRARAAGDDILLGDALMQLAQVFMDFQRPADALANFEAAHHLFDELGDDQGLRGAESGMVRAALASGDLDHAAAIVDRVIAAASESSQSRTMAAAELLIGLVAEATGRPDDAAAAFGATLDYARDSGDIGLLQRAAARLASLELSLDNVDAAAELIEEIREYAGSSRDFLRLDARLALAKGEPDTAGSILRELRNRAGEAWTEDDEALLASIQP